MRYAFALGLVSCLFAATVFAQADDPILSDNGANDVLEFFGFEGFAPQIELDRDQKGPGVPVKGDCGFGTASGCVNACKKFAKDTGRSLLEVACFLATDPATGKKDTSGQNASCYCSFPKKARVPGQRDT